MSFRGLAAKHMYLGRRILEKSVLRPRNFHSHSPLGINPQFLKVSEEVRDAVATGKPVVALETTIYTHGFPYPENVALASRLESIVRSAGGVPATIGILNGVARVGLEPNELTELASSAFHGKDLLKVSRRDLGYICGLGLRGKRINGGTTIAGTMVLAQLAGIKVFATGGLGGVHRGGENSMDISADLTELGRTPLAVISSGCKSFLDIPRTLEYLETEGVLVATFADGRKGRIDFPAFFSRDSGVKSPKVIQDEAEAAAIIYAQSRLPVSSGLLFANPVPEKYAFPKDEMDAIIEKAVELARVEGAHGSDNTPFVLAKIKELSGGRSVAANTALVESNVERGTKVAVELSKLESGLVDRHMPGHMGVFEVLPEQKPSGQALKNHDEEVSSSLKTAGTADILVAGALAVDLACDYAPLSQHGTSPSFHTSNPSRISQSLGGVGHNVAVAASHLGSRVLFCSAVADDLSGRAALAGLGNVGLCPDGVQKLDPSTTGARTAQYIAINDAKKDLLIAMADMSILEMPEERFNFDGLWEPLIRRSRPSWAVIDANWGPDVFSRWIILCRNNGIKVALEPVSAPKSTRLFTGKAPVFSPSNVAPNHLIDLITPNQFELAAMHAAAREAELFDSSEWWRLVDALGMPSSGSRDRLVSLTTSAMVDAGIPQQSIQLLPFIPCIVTKLGAQGVLLTQLLSPGDSRLSSAEDEQYILSRSMENDPVVGGVYMRLFPAAEILSSADIVSVNGAGDTLLGAIVSALAMVKDGRTRMKVEDIIPIAQQASVRTLKYQGGVSPDIASLAPLLRSL
ncbi:hypothetical protein VTO42DRAFT_8640 [Malbranchea cinnamomea]